MSGTVRWSKTEPARPTVRSSSTFETTYDDGHVSTEQYHELRSQILWGSRARAAVERAFKLGFPNGTKTIRRGGNAAIQYVWTPTGPTPVTDELLESSMGRLGQRLAATRAASAIPAIVTGAMMYAVGAVGTLLGVLACWLRPHRRAVPIG